MYARTEKIYLSYTSGPYAVSEWFNLTFNFVTRSVLVERFDAERKLAQSANISVDVVVRSIVSGRECLFIAVGGSAGTMVPISAEQAATLRSWK